MNREDIIRMAREAGFQCLLPSEHTAATGCIYDSGDDEITPLLERFAALVASTEREACAKLCEENWHECGGQCANVIRYGDKHD